MYSKSFSVAILLALYLNAASAATTYKETDHAMVARRLVHQTNWAAISTISTHRKLKDYPMVQILSINDYDAKKQSTGRIQFLLTNLDFTGKDVKQNNKVSLLFNDEQLLHCSEQNLDPMEPTCARTIISGEVKRMDENQKDYQEALASFVARHPASQKWLDKHNFYLCELEITNIFVLDFYGGAHNIKPDDYYKVEL
ncbi:protein CREG1-like [Stomoxys calcitrans]|uniref:CREG-like beta-barrel domain-containing protein n=1 Tax=Stomoxys calcitrans TaxID=35570 RepID=A0A1I8PR88_STOCA|nr:protein CREG1-like [Stomoxys calcitrans]